MAKVVKRRTVRGRIRRKIMVMAGSILFLFGGGIAQKQEAVWKIDGIFGNINYSTMWLKINSDCFQETLPVLSYQGREQVWREYMGMNTGMIGYESTSEDFYETGMANATILLRNTKKKQVVEEISCITEDCQVENGIGDVFFEEVTAENKAGRELEKIQANKKLIKNLKDNMSTDYLIKNFYIVDSTTTVDEGVFQVKSLLQKDFSLKKEEKPQILIYHTHGATEAFKDSRKGKKEDSIVGVGGYLADILTNLYGYQVIHDETEYDNIKGNIDRNKAYNNALDGVQRILEENPNIEVLIDLHRDAVNNNNQRVTEINGKKTAQIMLFNGLSRNQRGAISYLYNPNLQANLAFSLQLKLAAMEKYPDFTIRNYLKGYRYNLHLRERSLLIELGNENSTVQEAKNAMEPLAELLNEILTADKKEE